HLHPVVGRLMIDIGRGFGLRAIRVPAEPPGVLAAAGGRPGFGDRALHRWTALLRAQARRAGMIVPAQCFGLAWSGHMTRARLLALAPHLPEGLSELYFHPATRQDDTLARLMPTYEPAAELAALCDPDVAAAFGAAAPGAVRRTTYAEETARCRR
ncbi:MAG: ChbG/HpnK family deacetylase, partial [Acetobacteraceae bacterium]